MHMGEQMYTVEISVLASCRFSMIDFLATVSAFWHFHESILFKEIEEKENPIKRRTACISKMNL